MSVSAVILLSGESLRFGLDIPKQFIKLGNKYLFQYSLETFENHKSLNEIILVVHPSYLDFVKEVVKKYSYKKVTAILQGGKTRQKSSAIGVSQVRNINSLVLIHDAARPFVSEAIITECIKQLKYHSTVSTCIAVSDTLYVQDEYYISEIPDRKKFLRAQTPQGFWLEIIQKAHQLATEDNYLEASDDCSLVNKYMKERIYCIMGDERNIKITYPLDEEIASFWIERS
jgi:ribitol-5-phosphate 2-dehydrogenase (NADP+) / D-ribitol-5-phosphate cytidylyltransferase